MDRRPCWVEVSTGAFEDNYRLLAQACGGNAGPSAPRCSAQDDNNFESALDSAQDDNSGDIAGPVEVLAIVKADAYGHGLELCAPAAVRAGARWLGVTSVEEGVAARVACPDAEILVIGGVFPGQGTAVVEQRLTAVVWDELQLDELEAAAQAAGAGSVPVHLELDTGMSRQGVGPDELDGMLGRLAQAGSAVRLDGLMTHLYAAMRAMGWRRGEQFAALERMVERGGCCGAYWKTGAGVAACGGIRRACWVEKQWRFCAG